MLNKEEIEFNLKALSGVMLNFEDRLCDEMQERVKEVKEYIEQLESEKQKLIEKLEEDIKEFGNYAERKEMAREQLYENDGRWFYCQEILSILKGEKK